MIGCAVEIGRAFRRAGLDSAGELHSRVDYTPYGVAMHSYAADLNGNGTIDGTDVGLFLTNLNSGSPLEPGDANYDPDADLSGDGLLGGTATDEFNAFNARYSAYSTGGSNPTVNAGWIDSPTDAGGPDNSVGYDGYWFDLAGAVDSGSTGLYIVRHRVYDPGMGRWGERDPLGYLDGSLLVLYAQVQVTRLSDRYGLCAASSSCEEMLKKSQDDSLVKLMRNQMDIKKCKEVTFVCEECEKKGRGAYVDPEKNAVVICKSSKNYNQDIFTAIVVHELAHAFDECLEPGLFSDCEKRACSEVRAYNLSGQCQVGGAWRLAGETHEDCIRRNAEASVKTDEACNASKAVDAVIADCIKSASPFPPVHLETVK